MLIEVNINNVTNTSLLIPLPAVFSSIEWLNDTVLTTRQNSHEYNIIWDQELHIIINGVGHDLLNKPIFDRDVYTFTIKPILTIP